MLARPAPDHVLLRRHASARARGDLGEANATWEQLTLQNLDRIKQIVKAFRFSAGGSGLPEPEWGSAASEAYLRALAMGPNFEAQEAGRYYAALVTLVQNSCLDYGRKELRHERRKAGSIDKTYDPDGEAGPYDAALAGYDADLRQRSIEAVEDELERQGAEQLVAWAIGQIANDNYRKVLEMTYIDKLSADQIAEGLGITMDNVYARRSRGVRELEKILRDHSS
jgi:RNA polymerase sigma factor (sigma-70 family)